MMKKISVIMSLYGESLEWLSESINSILNQDIEIFEFIIVNDNPSRSELKNFLNYYAFNYPSIIIINNTNNLGLIASLNCAVSLASGDFIARMDADDISLPERISTQLLYLENNGFDLIGSNVEVIDQHGLKMYDSNKILSNTFIDSILLLGTVPLVHPTYFGRSNVFKSCLYNPLAIYAEDMEFIAHARTIGFKIGNCPSILLKYRFSESSITKSNALKSYVTAMNVKKAYKNYKRTGNYLFSPLNTNISEHKIKKFNNRQIFMNYAKNEIIKGQYIKFIYFLFKAMFSDVSFFNIVYINIMQRYYVFKESRK